MQNWKNSKIVLFSNLFSTFQMINAKLEKFQDSIVLQSVFLLEPLPNIGELETNSDVCERKIRSNSYFYRTQVYLGSDLCVWMSVQDLFWDLTDVTLADEDTNSIQTDDANKAIQGNVAMQVALPGGQICNWCKQGHLMAKFATDARNWWPSLEWKQMAPPGG